jgi:Uma2 family endonuclease
MQAAPSRQHQRIVSQLVGEWYLFLKGEKCEVYTAPFDVRLAAVGDEEEYKLVQPDISVICDVKKLDDKGCKGAPDLIAEFLSPSTWRRDRIEKLNQYQKNGVREYLMRELLNNIFLMKIQSMVHLIFSRKKMCINHIFSLNLF